MDSSINNSNSSFSSTNSNSNSNSDSSSHAAQRRRRRPRRALSIPSRNNNNTTNSSQTATRGVFRSSTFESRLRPYHSHNNDLSLPLVTSDLPSTTPSCNPPLARIHSGSAVAGFVVGTTFEAALMGFLAFLHVNGAVDDPPLFVALLLLFVMASWSGIFHVVLHQMDVLLDMAHDPLLLYTHFTLGLATGLGLECAILHRILSARAAPLLQSQPQGVLGIVSVVFGLGCVGLTILRTYYRDEHHKKKVFQKKKQLHQYRGDNHNHNNNNNKFDHSLV